MLRLEKPRSGGLFDCVPILADAAAFVDTGALRD